MELTGADFAMTRTLRLQLAAHRRRGVDFDTAWSASMCALPWPEATQAKQTWSTALHATRPAWQSAYERRPPPRRQLAPARLEGLAA